MLGLFLENDENKLEEKRKLWSNRDKLELADALFKYLKYDGVKDDYDDKKRRVTTKTGRIIQYVNRVVTSEFDNQQYGYEDTLVWVGESFSSDSNESERTFLGMQWESLDIQIKVIDMLPAKTLQGVVFAIAMHEGMNP